MGGELKSKLYNTNAVLCSALQLLSAEEPTLVRLSGSSEAMLTVMN